MIAPSKTLAVGWLVLGAAFSAAGRANAQTTVGETEPLAVLVGNYGPKLPGLYGTDLGWSFKHGNKLWMLFGDSWATREQHYIGTPISFSDDALGYIPLDPRAGGFADGEAVEAHVRNSDKWATRGWKAGPEILKIVPTPGAQPIQLWHGITPLNMGPGLTPVTGFSNARVDSSAGAFGIFFGNVQVQCYDGCGAFSCDRGLGLCVKRGERERNPVSMACVLDAPRDPSDADCATCKAYGGGLCQDPRSSMYDSTPRGRVSTVVMSQGVGCATNSSNVNAEPLPQFDVRAWNTHRFFNPHARTVNDFDPSRANGIGNDYKSADGVNPAREGVFIWGRPHFGGLSDLGRDAQLYLAWVAMPSYATGGNFAWSPRYFAGFDAQGRPRFVTNEVDSVPLDLSSGSPEGPSKEELDIVGQMSVSWIPSLGRWVMIYGGGLGELFGKLILGSDWTMVNAQEVGPLYIRTAAQPWGPWTAPRRLLDPGKPNPPTGMYAAGGILRSPQCIGDACVDSESAWTDPGGLYGPNIIEPWTRARTGAVDLYWNLSTWNPYEVVLMKTTLSANDVR